MKSKHKKKHHGITVLLLAVTLLLISMLLILFAAQYSALQQKISANLYRNQQAFEAAEAGLEAGIAYFQTNYVAIKSNASGGYLTPYLNSSTQNVYLANGSKYSFVFTNPTSNNYQLITVTSTGVNADGTSTRIITQQIQTYGNGISAPTFTLITKGGLDFSSNAIIRNTTTNSNLNAGGSIDISNSAHTITSSGTTSTSSALGSDATENNSALSSLSADSFFQSIFGATQATVKSNANYTFSYVSNHTYNSNLDGVTGSLIWIDQLGGQATINSTTSIGSVSRPVILIVNGNLLIGGSATIYGLVFILNPTNDVTIRKDSTINGALSSTGNIKFQGDATLNYNSSILNALPSVNGVSNYAKVPGSWRDF
jgi:Tfp pilus assembly protein PilX